MGVILILELLLIVAGLGIQAQSRSTASVASSRISSQLTSVSVSTGTAKQSSTSSRNTTHKRTIIRPTTPSCTCPGLQLRLGTDQQLHCFQIVRNTTGSWTSADEG